MKDHGLTRVTMRLTKKDIENAEMIADAIRATNNAVAVSTALAIVAKLYEYPDNDVIIRAPDGSTSLLLIPR